MLQGFEAAGHGEQQERGSIAAMEERGTPAMEGDGRGEATVKNRPRSALDDTLVASQKGQLELRQGAQARARCRG